MTTLTVNHLIKSMPTDEPGETTVNVVDDVSFKLQTGDVLSLLGPSGCGKSTLLRLLAGLIQPDSGEVLYDNVPLNTIPMAERGIGMVFQDGALAPHWEARKTIGFFLWLRQREAEVPERVRRIAQITGIGMDHLLDKRPSQLSGGEKQRIGIARALARDPRLFLFDEPFSNLDAKLRSVARIELRRLLNAFPVTSVYVTHDQIEAVALANRIAVMRAGKIEQMGTYESLHNNPLNMFVATFVGTPIMNLFPGRSGDHTWEGMPFSAYPFRGDFPLGTQVTLGVRPEHIRIVPADAPNAAFCQVTTVTPFFAERFRLLEVSDRVQTWRITVPYDSGLVVGDSLYTAPNPENMLFFDTRTGARVG
ncbi:MAG: ABC transporter ATP-binding protein [Pleurocapsa minor GSE-CHR-MK-17-07R]|nr:ABC transporter ATP-binding protein [Pleurocapsa minor GSE-CHR-MK 17-07R]